MITGASHDTPPAASASTYDLLAASLLETGDATFTMRFEFISSGLFMVVVPVTSSLPLMVTLPLLSTLNCETLLVWRSRRSDAALDEVSVKFASMPLKVTPALFQIPVRLSAFSFEVMVPCCTESLPSAGPPTPTEPPYGTRRTLSVAVPPAIMKLPDSAAIGPANVVVPRPLTRKPSRSA